jgi:hypothetical protein
MLAPEFLEDEGAITQAWCALEPVSSPSIAVSHESLLKGSYSVTLRLLSSRRPDPDPES